MLGGGFADFLKGLQPENEEVDVRDKAVEQRRQITERYHAAIERGRHPRSFGRVNDLWRHIKNAEERRSSVARGQRLRRVSSLPTELTPIKVNHEKRGSNVKRRSLNSAASSDDNLSDSSDESDDGKGAYVTTRQPGNNNNNSNSLKSRSNSYGGNSSRASSRGRGSTRDRTQTTGVLNMAALKAERKGHKAQTSIPPSRETQYQVRPTSGDESDVAAQLQKQKRIEEKHGSVERRTHKLGRRMSMFRINDAAIKDLPRMVGRRELQGDNLVANGGKNPKKYSQDELSSVPPAVAQARRRKMKKKRYTQRLVGLDGRGESEYDPTPDKVERVESRRQSYFGTFSTKNNDTNNNTGNNASTIRVPKGLAPEVALKQVDSQKRSLIDLEASTTSLGEGGKEETTSSSNNKNKSDDGAAQQKVQLRAKKKEVLPEFTSILNATVFYGSVVALQMSDGKYLTVMEDNGEIKAHHWPGVEKYGIRQKATHPGPDAQNGRMLFTLYDMRNPGNQEPIKYGDPVWLAVCPGNGGGRAKGTPTPPSAWKLGSCISARIMKAPQLATIGLESSSVIRNPDKETVNVGTPVPLPCVVQSTGGKGGGKELWLQGPITKENQDGWYSKKDLIYEKLYKEKNAAAMSLGRWFMLPVQIANQESIRRSKASYAARTVIEGLLEGQNKSHLDDPNGYEKKELINGTEIYLERDWFYISGNPSKINRDQIIVRQLPGTNEDSALSPDNKNKFKKLIKSKKGKSGDSVDKELEVDRRGVFKIRLISGGQRPKGQNKEQQKVEATFHMARQQLKKSRAFRNGDTVEYEGGNIKGGEKFSMQVRLIHQDVDLNNDNKFLSYEDDKLTRLESYFEDLYENSPVRILDDNPVRMKRGRIRSSSIISLARSRTSRGSVASVKSRPIKSRNSRLLNLLHQSVSGPHINLWDPDRMVSARLHKEARDEQQTREEQSRQENRLSRLMKYANLPEDELPSRSASLAGSRPTSKASSRPVSRAVPRMKEEHKDVVSDDAVARLLGIDKHTRPMNEVLGDEDDSMKTTIFASQQVEYRIRTAKRRKREASRRKKNEQDRKARLLQAEIEKAEVAAKLHEIGQKRAEEAARARAEAERQRLS